MDTDKHRYSLINSLLVNAARVDQLEVKLLSTIKTQVDVDKRK